MARLRWAAMAALVVMLAVAGGAVGGIVAVNLRVPDPHEVCDGVTRLSGGCDPDQPTFAGTDCDQVGLEFGAQVNRRGLAIIDGPASVNEESRAVRMSSMLILMVMRADRYLVEERIRSHCSVQRFVASAETQFTIPFTSRVGNFLDDQYSHPYSEWLEELRRFVRAIDMPENEPDLDFQWVVAAA